MKRFVIIVAAGSGKRIGGAVPKQFLEMDGTPILMRTIVAFSHIENIIVVLNEDYIEFWRELCVKHNFNLPHTVVKGGVERFHSVKNALVSIPDDAIVAIHDGVRPFVTHDVIEEAFAVAERDGAAVPVIDCPDSVRILSNDGSESNPFDRSRVKLVQTPQVFKAEIIKKAYNAEFDNSFTDDASVVERAGFKVALTRGCTENKKITFRSDL
ncbi:MAG: 2-C-methyl-D-erythritol 4-phosphate cytidylyltransferase [Paludibacteraceae bacterium]|nr:2-C-methyl-D-erythritol 4-phosphate cytidylyltransferase [Paludibacteraceae bacterium]